MNVPKKIREIFERHRRHWLTVAFILGFVVDNITLNRVDELFDNIVLATYVILAMGSILALYAGTAERFSESLSRRARKYAPLVAQYAFGGLFSGVLIFYGRSGSWFESWPFLLGILAVIFGNETIKDRASRLIFNVGVLFVGLIAYVVLVVPVAVGMMGEWVFVGSTLLALLVMYLFLRVLRSIVPRFFEIHSRAVVFTIGIIFASFHFLYFTNTIPPIPLSLKEVGIYHSVVRFDDGSYRLTYEKPKWWQFFKNSDSVFHAEAGENIFCFASVFAPSRLNTEIFHRWEYYDEAKAEWVQRSRLSYGIAGGRGDGYRGYTLITKYVPGKWRCVVETARGQILGAETFTVEEGAHGELVTREE